MIYKIEQQTSECIYEGNWRKPVMEGNGLPEEIPQNCSLYHTAWVYMGSANRFILSTLWWPHSGQIQCRQSQNTVSVLKLPLSGYILTLGLISFYTKNIEINQAQPCCTITFYKWLIRQPEWEQSKCHGRVTNVEIRAISSSGLLCLVCVHPSGPTASSPRGLLLGHPTPWFSGFLNPSSWWAVPVTESFCFPQPLPIHKEIISRDPQVTSTTKDRGMSFLILVGL